MTVQAEVGWAKTSRFKYTQTRFERPFGKYLSFTRIDGLSSYATYYHENENISLDEQFTIVHDESNYCYRSFQSKIKCVQFHKNSRFAEQVTAAHAVVNLGLI